MNKPTPFDGLVTALEYAHEVLERESDEPNLGGGKAMAKKQARPTTYSAGFKVEYTGKVEELYGGTFYQVRVLEGPEKGKLKDIINPPPSVSQEH